jgi:hypothetical protein
VAQIARYYRLKKKTNSLKIALNKKRAKFKQALKIKLKKAGRIHRKNRVMLRDS